MTNPLHRIPGLAGYVAAGEDTQRNDFHNLRQLSGATSLAAALREQEQAQLLNQALAQSNGDPEQAMASMLQAGNLAGAARLAPIVEARRKATQGRVMAPGSQLLGPQNQVLHTVPHRPEASPELLRLQTFRDSLPEGSPQRAEIDGRIRVMTERPDRGSTSPLGLLMAERDALAPDHPNRAVYDQAITKFQPGGVTVNLSPNAPLVPGKPAQNKVDEGLLDTGMRQQQLTAIQRQFKPEYQQLGTRWNALSLSIKDKVGLTDLDPGQKQFLTEFSQYKRNSIDSLNQYIKSITGAAMTDAEAARILRGLPNPGTGLMDGDSPTEFKAKLDDALKQTRMAEARLVYIRRRGMSLGDVELNQMPSLMNKRGAEVEAAIRQHQPKMAEADVRAQVRRYLAAEFGLVE